jgi:hypothetical protein
MPDLSFVFEPRPRPLDLINARGTAVSARSCSVVGAEADELLEAQDGDAIVGIVWDESLNTRGTIMK